MRGRFVNHAMLSILLLCQLSVCLDFVPRFDGLVAANGQLYLSSIGGEVLCLRGVHNGKNALSLGFKTIAEIGKERIRLAAKKIKEENKGKLDFDGKKLDLGFKVFRLEENNFKQWRENVKTGEELKEQMKMFVDNIKKGAGSEDMLFEIILKNSRFDLNVNVEKKTLARLLPFYHNLLYLPHLQQPFLHCGA